MTKMKDLPKNLFIFEQNDKEIGRIISADYIAGVEQSSTVQLNIGSMLVGGLQPRPEGHFRIAFDYDSELGKIIYQLHHNIGSNWQGYIFSLKYYYNIFKHTPNETDLELAISTKNMLDSGYGEITKFNNCAVAELDSEYRYDIDKQMIYAKIKFGLSEVL